MENLKQKHKFKYNQTLKYLIMKYRKIEKVWEMLHPKL